MSDAEKHSAKSIADGRESKEAQIEDAATAGIPRLPEAGSPERLAMERKLVRKLDRRLLPMMIVVYILNYIDRLNITTARLKGLEQDLKLDALKYSVALSIIYATYCPFQIPSNMILNYIKRPSWYIGLCVIFWGLASLLTGVTTSYGGILACRIFIGLPESAFYPGGVYLLSRWYTKKELAFRGAILYSGLLISNAFGALMAAGILSRMEGARGVRAWRWLFYIEGAMTITIGFIVLYVLPDYPHNTRWITGTERHLAQVRMAEDAGEADRDTVGDTPWNGLKLALTDPLVLVFAVMNMSQLLGLGFINFFPTLTATLGFSTTISLLLAAPPWIFSSFLCSLNAWDADRTGERFFHTVRLWWLVILGYIIALSTNNTGARYFSMYLMACGHAAFPMTGAWVSNTVARPPAKRAAAIGIVNGIGNVGNLMSAFTWKADFGPGYHESMIISLCCLVFSTILAFGIRQHLISRNKKLDADELAAIGEAEELRVKEAAALEGITVAEAMERRKGFRYLY
ncbi:MFS general substrate transporter [Mycena kentingensis (nom. inval.)]|nr:MFS general substrate transporter [Mycena kentingensis (nom. inval.)]